MERDPRRRRRGVAAIPLILPALVSLLISVGRIEAVAEQRALLLIEAGEDADGIYASIATANNRTSVFLTGFIGSPTSYSELLRVCNAGLRRLTLRLEAVEVARDRWAPSVFTAWLVKPGGARSLLLSLPVLATSAPIELEPGECASIGVEVLIPATASAGETATITISFTGI